MVKVIINADDLGISHLVNQAIDNDLSKKLISSSTIMANSLFWDEIHAIVNKHPEASFGIHLNLTEGKAMTQSVVLEKYGIVDSNNSFTKKIKTIKSFTKELLEAIYEEWDAQIKKIVETEGVMISHLDGHHHVHAITGLKPVIIALVNKYQIAAVRSAYRKPMDFFFRQHFRLLNPIVWVGYLKMMLWRNSICVKTKMTDYFDSYETVCNDLSRGMSFNNDCIVELMCHPGHPLYEKENALIANNRVFQLLKEPSLVNYKVFS